MKRNYVYEEWKDIKGYEGLYQISNFRKSCGGFIWKYE